MIVPCFDPLRICSEAPMTYINISANTTPSRTAVRDIRQLSTQHYRNAVVYLVEALCSKPEGRGFDSR
jgi:hypothetical protein